MFEHGSSRQHLWISWDGELAHPDAPAGGGGPGLFKGVRPLGTVIDFDASLPHAQSPAARTFAVNAAEIKRLAASVPNASGGASTTPAKKLTISGVIVAGGPLNDATIDLVNEAAKKASNKRYIAYETVVNVGGSIAWRANNPGNLRSASTQIGSAPGAVGKFAVFATMADGRAAQRSLYLNTYGSMAVKAAVEKLTPSSENDTSAYLKKLEAAGIDLTRDVKSQIDKLMSAIEANEGMITGTAVTRVP